MTSIISDLLEFTQTSFHSLEVTRSYFVDIVDHIRISRTVPTIAGVLKFA